MRSVLHVGSVLFEPAKMSCCVNTKFITGKKTREEKIRNDLTHQVIHSFLWSWQWKPRGCATGTHRDEAFLGGWCIHFLQPHACWHPCHGLADRQVHYRWFVTIAETRLTAQHKNSSLLSLDKTLIFVFRLPKCLRNGHVFYCRLDISVSPLVCNVHFYIEGIFTSVCGTNTYLNINIVFLPSCTSLIGLYSC